MPLNVRTFCTSVVLVLASAVITAEAQTVQPSVKPSATPPVTPAAKPSVAPQTAPTSGDVMRERITKAKAFIAVRNYNAAIYELENIRRETADGSVQAVVSVLLMNSYLEQGDFKRAQDFLTQFYNAQKTTRPNAVQLYDAVAGQVIKGARSRAERYRALGLSLTDRTLPLEAANDLDKMRETLELVITQSKEIAKDTKKTAGAMVLVEEASTSRSILARDDYDARRWKDGVADAREELANSRSVVLSAVNDTPADKPNGDLTAANTKTDGNPQAGPPASEPVLQPVTDPKLIGTREREVRQADPKPVNTKPTDDAVAKNDKPVFIPSAPATVKETPKTNTGQPARTDLSKDSSPLDVGSLVAYATRQAPVVYPQVAKTTRTTGIVKVEVTVDEKGEVAEVQKTSGPAMLQGAARDAIRKWRFRPFVRDGQPVRATGFVSFNFAL
jgi:TonB family protein